MDYEVAIALGYVTGPKLPKLSWWRIRWNRFLAFVRPNKPPRVHYDRPSCDVLPENRNAVPLVEAYKLLSMTRSTDADWRKVPQVTGNADPACDAMRRIQQMVGLTNHLETESSDHRMDRSVADADEHASSSASDC